MEIKLATFVKTPGFSPLKTRLANSSSRQLADSFYQLSVTAIEEWMIEQEQFSVRCHWAVAENPCLIAGQWPRFPNLWQGDGGLDQRLATICAELQFDGSPILLIGADAPQLSANLCSTTQRLFESGADIVVGPSSDGGFYLFGSRIPIARSTWLTVEYSKESTLADLLAQPAFANCRIEYLQKLTDVDEFSDLTALQTELSKLSPQLLPAQEKMLVWLSNALTQVY